MDRKITIPELNEGKEFEVPVRKTRHKKKYLETMACLKISDKLREDQQYMVLQEYINLSYIVLKDTLFPKIKMEEIEDIEEEILYKLGRIINNVDEVEYLKQLDIIKERLLKRNFQTPVGDGNTK